ncbi:MAG TPA: hypothetical protein VGX00_08155 [Thermoplasmata archaeon]|nr:hypothetical protein [Thermoplasmata archaeon]
MPDFEVGSLRDTLYRSQYRTRTYVFDFVGVLVPLLAVGYLYFALTRGTRYDWIAAGILLISAAACAAGVVIVNRGNDRLIKQVKVGPEGVSFTPTKGIPISMSWNAASFRLSLSDVQRPTGSPRSDERYFINSVHGGDNRLGFGRCLVSGDAFSAILDTARSNGLSVEVHPKEARPGTDASVVYDIQNSPSAPKALNR